MILKLCNLNIKVGLTQQKQQNNLKKIRRLKGLKEWPALKMKDTVPDCTTSRTLFPAAKLRNVLFTPKSNVLHTDNVAAQMTSQ